MNDLIIIGAGPAGLTAALYAGRFRLKTMIFEKMSVGGQIILSSSIENYPGFPSGISTFELVERFQKQAEEAGIKIEQEEVLEIIPHTQGEDEIYKIKTKEGLYETKTVIVASGAQSKQLGVPGEDKFVGRGVSYCATCDGPLFKNKEVVVVGGGDRAIEEAIFLSVYSSKVNVVHRRGALRASKILEEKAKKNARINFLLESVIEEIQGIDKVSAVRIKNLKTGNSYMFACEAVFIFVGIRPSTSFLKNILDINDDGFIITDLNMQTSRRGIFACGDCIGKNLYQVVNACGEGAVASDSAHKYLLNR